MPAKAHVILLAHKDQPSFALEFDYQSVTGKLNYLAQTSRPDMMYTTHQIAKYSSDPRLPHSEAIMYLVRYLVRSRDVGICFSPNSSKGFECFCNANFSGNWNKSGAAYDPSTAKSRSGWIIFYAGCPIIWASKIQLQVSDPFYHWSWIYCSVNNPLRSSSNHVLTWRDEGQRFSSHMHSSACLLQGFRGQLRSPGIGTITKTSSTH